MAQWILKVNGRVVPRRSLRPLKVDEIHSPIEIKKREVFDELIKRRWGTPMTPPNTQQPKAFEKYEDHEQQEQPTLEVEDIVDSTGKLINQQPAYDQIINAEVQLHLGEKMVHGKVIQRTIGPDGQVTETYDNNPFLNSIIYDVEFPDGQVKEYAANIIAENTLTQVDSDGMSTTLMEAIVDHRRDDEKALQHHDKYVQTKNGRHHLRKTQRVGSYSSSGFRQVRKVQLENGVNAWAFSSSQYVQTAVKNVEAYLDSQDSKHWKMSSKVDTPLTTTYRPELDISRELNVADAAYYQSLIGILRWIVELGRVDVCLEVSMMSSHLALPREGHLEQVLHIFAYLKKYQNTELVYDPSDPVVDENDFERRDWASSEFGHVEGEEEFPAKMPEPRGHGFIMRAKVDADHASDTISRRSRTGFLIDLNCALVYWWNKKQTSVESSSFGSEFVAMKRCCECIRGLRYKLRMMGIPVEGPTCIHGDNQSVLANRTIPDSTLKQKSQSIAYHFVHEGVSRDEWRTSYVNTHDNEADLLTKQLPHGEKRKGFVSNLLHHIFGLSDSVVRK